MTSAHILKLNSVQVLALGCLGVMVGAWLQKKLPWLDRLCIPTSIVGGMLFALAALLLHSRGVDVDADGTLRDLLMIAFMTTIGLNASMRLLWRGGPQMALMLALASAGAVAQNLLGMGLAKVFGLNPLVGILSGSVALTGGPATSLAFGPTFERMGVAGATELATASAIFGIAVSGLVGGYIGNQLVRRHRLQPDATAQARPAAVEPEPEPAAALLTVALVIGIAMGVGNLISSGFQRIGLILPAYIGAMIAAAILRNVNDRLHLFRISASRLNDCATLALYLFIVMALLTLQLWKLAHLVLPLVIMLAAQVALVWLLCVTASFYLMGRDYESAVMASGFCGFMLGITANAVACMEELVIKYGPAPRAFLVVPVVGAFLIDFTNALIITVMANFVR